MAISYGLKGFLVCLLVLSIIQIPSPLIAQEEHTESSWQKAGRELREAADAIGDASKESWDKTKDASGEIWHATKESGEEALEATKEGGKNLWQQTKSTSQEVVAKAKSAYRGNESGPTETTSVENSVSHEAGKTTPGPASTGTAEAPAATDIAEPPGATGAAPPTANAN